MFDTGSLDYSHCVRRLEGLYTQSHRWLVGEAKKLTRHNEDAEELVSDLYLYLLERCKPEIFWGKDTFNLYYCNKFLYSRWMNKVKKKNKIRLGDPDEGVEEIPYDEEEDRRIYELHEQVQRELKNLEITKLWPAAKIFSLYFGSEDTMESLARKIGISKSTTFLAIKRIRGYLKMVITPPDGKEEKGI